MPEVISEIKTLNVTELEPRLKHPTIFQYFDNLEEGEAFIIHNDHDPLPLYYQLKSLKGDIFTWEYLERGPQVFEIKIAKKVFSREEETVGEIAAKDLRNAEIFRKFGLEFCCDGKKSLQESCNDAGASIAEVQEALKNLPEEKVNSAQDYNSWGLDFLADYIVNVHHKYVKDSTSMLRDLADKIASHHGSAHPELYEIKEHVDALLNEMKTHQEKEEKVLFPFIHEMVKNESEGRPVAIPASGSLDNPVEMLRHEHDEVGRHVHAIEKLSHGYEVPADGCGSYRLYFSKLEELDKDLHQHLHLENNILFPKSIKLERKLAN